ncbi:hypothetical protein [Hymenobacter sp. B1770]|uniref:hypothetical protein n=1 Tax=Hymenobacter sp. B1770 TaxID=1718788 RepID=UPI003CF37917
MTQRLIFVYNAAGGLLPGLKNMFHKLLSPATYPCSLCGITYGATQMLPEWKEFIKSLPMPVDFLHREEFVRDYPQWRHQQLPAAFTATASGELTPFIGAEEMDTTDLNGLMRLVHARLK